MACTNVSIHWTSYASEIFGIKGGWTVSTRERGWFKKGVMKVVTLCVDKALDGLSILIGVEHILFHKINVYICSIYAHMRRRVVQHVTRFMTIMVVYTEFHEIDPNFKTFLHSIIKKILKWYSLSLNHDRKQLPCV